jgi:hypothetical protein
VALLIALCPSVAAAEPASGPRQDVDQSFTTTSPASPTGIGFSGSYHAAGDPAGNPPFLRRMVFFPPRGMKYRTGVPKRCTANDGELSMNGPDACPEGSKLGEGTTEGIFYIPFTEDVVLDHFKHNVYVMNNTNEQIILVEAEGYSVTRGQMRPDGAIDFVTPTCFPTPPTGECLDDHILQLKIATFVPPYTKQTKRGRTRSYATTPPRCPARGHWRTKIKFWWSDGSIDRVVSKQPCTG